MVIRPISLTKKEQEKYFIDKIGIDREALSIFLKKLTLQLIEIKDISIWAANILKQVSLCSGGDLAVHRDVISGRKEKSTALMIGNERVLRRIAQRIKDQNYRELTEISDKILFILDSSKPKELNVKGTDIDLSKTLIMGILNITPDSFYDGGKFFSLENALKRAYDMIDEGVDIIDIGGESTRPGSKPVSFDEEKKRLLNFLNEFEAKDVLVSVDTNKYDIVKIVADRGVDFINDTSGLKDTNILEPLKANGTGYILMHIKGVPETMQNTPQYDDFMKELYNFFSYKMEIISKHIKLNQVVIDPGIGFGKRDIDNYAIFNHITELKSFNRPLLIGHSRKSFIGRILKNTPSERGNASNALSAILIKEGVNIIRTHDVKETYEIRKVINAIY